MLKINTNDFTRYNCKSLFEFLFVQNETEFQVIIHRNATASKKENYDVFEEYLSAAYAGQRLSEIAKSFAYDVPSVNSHSPFKFWISTTEMGKLAEVLFIITQSSNKSEVNEPFLTFHSLAADFFSNVTNNKAECNTWGLLWIANQYLQKS